jgi:hypothetical protein
LHDVQPIDFVAIEQAAEDAAYDITEIILDLEGEVLQAPCADCNGEERTFLELESGQRFELRGEPRSPGVISLHAQVFDWREGHIYIQSPGK